MNVSMKLIVLIVCHHCSGSLAEAQTNPIYTCTNKPQWKSSAGNDCAKYKDNNWCTFQGEKGCGWRSWWWDIKHYASGGVSALEACCFCGGGERAAPTTCSSPIGNTACKSWHEYASDVDAEYTSHGPGMQQSCKPAFHQHSGKQYRGVIMLLHGFSACPQQFVQLVPKLTDKGFAVLLPVLPGHGALCNDEKWNGIALVGGGADKKDFVKLLPTDEKQWMEFGKRMSNVLTHASGETAVFGLSGGGVLASYMASIGPNTRQLIAVPLVRMAGVFDAIIRFANFLPLGKWTSLSWGSGCEEERAAGRAGICQFYVDNVAAMRDFGSEHESYAGMLTNADGGSLQAIFVHNDPSIDVNAALSLFKKLGLGTDSAHVCGFDETVNHSFLSPFDKIGENKYWLNEATDMVADYLADGIPIPQDGTVHQDGEAWPRCRLKCTASSSESSCSWQRPAAPAQR